MEEKNIDGLVRALSDKKPTTNGNNLTMAPFVASALDYFLDGVRGKRILDVGCGSDKANEGFTDDFYGPNLCRILNEKGAYPAGIDANIDASKEKFECYKISAENGIHRFSKDYFDAVVTSNFFNSPDFWKSEDDINSIINSIYPVLKDNGYYFNFEINMGEEDEGRLLKICSNNGLRAQINCRYKDGRYMIFRKEKSK